MGQLRLIAYDWTNLTVAGAFIGGIIVGGAAAIRLTRYLMEYLRRDNDQHHR